MSNVKDQVYINGPAVDARYGWSSQTRWRRTKDTELAFPQPIRVKGRTLYKLAELEEWERRMAAVSKAADAFEPIGDAAARVADKLRGQS
jgi:predicted DNA-binding transcriptional regulator AlpA